MKVTTEDLDRHDGNAEELMLAINKYKAAWKNVWTEICEYERTSPKWRGMLTLHCALNGLCLIPLDSIDAQSRPSYWTSIRTGPSLEFYYWVAPTDFFQKTS